jgi:hypothetical protein
MDSKGNLLYTNYRLKRLIFVILGFTGVFLILFLVGGPNYWFYIQVTPCFSWLLIIFISSIFFIELPLRIYQNGIQLPKMIFNVLILRDKTFYSYLDITALYPVSYQVALGPGAHSGPQGGSLGVTSLLGINVETTDEKTQLIKFPTSMFKDPKNANDDFNKAIGVIRELFYRKKMRLIRNPPLLNDFELNEYLGIEKEHYSFKRVWQHLVAMVVVFGILIVLGKIITTYNIEPVGPAMLIALFISVLPLFFWVFYIYKKDQEKFEKLNQLKKYRAYQKEQEMRKYGL